MKNALAAAIISLGFTGMAIAAPATVPAPPAPLPATPAPINAPHHPVTGEMHTGSHMGGQETIPVPTELIRNTIAFIRAQRLEDSLPIYQQWVQFGQSLNSNGVNAQPNSAAPTQH